jgi:gluconate 2-dehydrogenase gamma chain
MTDPQLPFSDAETATLRAALDRMIPADEFPSACEAGVDNYLARQFVSDLADTLSAYRFGLDALDRAAAERFGAGFASLKPGQQDGLLDDPALSEFASMMAAHAAEGYYGDPANGGNLGCVSWRMIGFDPRWTVGAEEKGR